MRAAGQSRPWPQGLHEGVARRSCGTQAFAVQVSGPTGDTVISGGWSAGPSSPCEVQTVDARLTVLDAQGTSAVLSIRRNSVSGNASPMIRVANLTLRNGTADSAPVGLYVANSFGRIEVDNLIVHGHRASASQFLGGVAMTLDASSHDISLRNSLVYDNIGAFVGGGSPLASVLFTSLSLNSGRNWYVTNNTLIAGGGESSPVLRIQSDGNFWVINNVLRGGVAYTSSITGAGAAIDPSVRQLFNGAPDRRRRRSPSRGGRGGNRRRRARRWISFWRCF